MAKYEWILVCCCLICILTIAYLSYAIINLKKYNKWLKKKFSADEYILDEYGEWIKRISENRKIEEFLVSKQINRIAIYGVGRIGENLSDYLSNVGIETIYGIDQKPSKSFASFPVYKIHDELPSVDAIIITPAYAIESISQSLKEVTNVPLISIDELLFCEY